MFNNITWETVCQFVYSSSYVSLLHPTLLELLHRADELELEEMLKHSLFHFYRITIARAFSLHLCHCPEDVCWCQLPGSERRKKMKKQKCSENQQSNFNILFYLQFLCLPSYFKQLCDGVHKPLEVMVAHFLNFPVMVPDPCIQLIHEEAMFMPIVHRAEKKEINMKNEHILQSNPIYYI